MHTIVLYESSCAKTADLINFNEGVMKNFYAQFLHILAQYES